MGDGDWLADCLGNVFDISLKVVAVEVFVVRAVFSFGAETHDIPPGE
jgi:hypothetical protein